MATYESAAAARGKNRRALDRAASETIAVAESSTGGLIAAALLAVPGASAYFLGGAVVYTQASRAALLGIGDAEMAGMRASTEAYALLCARRVREKHGAIWGLGETGATGPAGNRYGDAAGHSCIAVAGPVERAITLETGSADRRANMEAFAKRALELFARGDIAEGLIRCRRTIRTPGILCDLGNDCRAGREAEFEAWFQGEICWSGWRCPAFCMAAAIRRFPAAPAIWQFLSEV